MNEVPGTSSAPPGRRAVLRLAAAACALSGTAAASGCAGGSGGHGAGIRRLTLATGLPGGPFARFGERLAEEINAREDGLLARVLSTSASVENLFLLGRGRADLALALGDSAADAVAGSAPFTAALPVRALARIYLNYTHLVVPEASAVRRVTDLAGRRTAVGDEGSGTAVVAARVLAAAGLARPVRRTRSDSTSPSGRWNAVTSRRCSGAAPCPPRRSPPSPRVCRSDSSPSTD